MSNWKDNLRKIEPYVPGEQPKGKIIKLNANENPYPPSSNVLSALRTFQPDKLRLYPDSSAHVLKQALAKAFAVQENQVFVGNGSDEVIAMAYMACFQSGKPILFPDITYSFYPVWCKLLQTPYQTIPLDSEFRIHLEDYSQPNGGIILPNPNAPTGIGLKTEEIKNLLDRNQESIVIIDEAYVDFGAESVVPLIQKYENLLVIQTFSKSRSLAGLRIGMAFGSETIIQTLEAVKNSYNSYTCDQLAILLGTASIEDKAYLAEISARIQATRTKSAQRLKELGFKVYPSDSNFLFVTHPKANAKEIFEKLREQGILIRYFNLPRIQNHLRITIGTEEDMDILLQAIQKLLS